MKRAFPRPELSDFDAESHVKAWVRIGEWAGQERLEAALQRCVAECHFFPKVDEIEERIPAADAVLRGVTDARCPDCGGTGWRQRDPSNRDNPFSRCHCWRKELRSA